MLAGVYMVILQPSYNKKLQANNNMPIPEWRLPPVIVGGVMFAIGLFWFAWTGVSVSWHIAYFLDRPQRHSREVIHIAMIY